MKNFVRTGTAILERQAYAKAQANRSSTGWTSPTVLYDRMNALDPAIQELQTLVQTYIVRTTFKDSWNDFYAQWNKFYNESKETVRRLTGPQILENKNYEATIETFRLRYEGYKAGYVAEKSMQNGPLPTPITPTPPPPPPSDDKPPSPNKKDDGGIKIPWWVWMLGGVAVVGGVYWIYKKSLVVRDARRTIDRALPGTLGALMPAGGREFGTFVAKHSPANDPSTALTLVPIGIAGDSSGFPSPPASPYGRDRDHFSRDRASVVRTPQVHMPDFDDE